MHLTIFLKQSNSNPDGFEDVASGNDVRYPFADTADFAFKQLGLASDSTLVSIAIEVK